MFVSKMQVLYSLNDTVAADLVEAPVTPEKVELQTVVFDSDWEAISRDGDDFPAFSIEFMLTVAGDYRIRCAR